MRPPILVDDRIGSREYAPALEEIAGVQVNVQRMEFGDFAFMSENGPDGPCWVGIERKTVRELMGDIDEGRFAGNQLAGFIKRYDFAFLIVEGWYRRNYETRCLEVPRGKGRPWLSLGHYAKLDGHLSTLRLKTPIEVVKTQRWQDTVTEVELLYRWFSKPWDQHGSHLRFPVTPHRGRRIEIARPGIVQRVAKEFSGIGWERARTAVRVFKSVRELGNSNEESWMMIDGVGGATAAKVVREIRGEEKEKGIWRP